MRKVILIGFALAAATASAQTLSQLSIPKKAGLKNIIPVGYDAKALCDLLPTGKPGLELEGDGDLTVNWPARFPQAARSEDFRNDYRLNCTAFSIERVDGKFITIRGLTPPQLYGILKTDYENQPFLFTTTGTQIEFGEGDTIQARTADDAPPRRDLVVAIRQNKGALQPLVFDGESWVLAYDRNFPVEVFQKSPARPFWERMVWDWKTKTMHFDEKYPFPER